MADKLEDFNIRTSTQKRDKLDADLGEINAEMAAATQAVRDAVAAKDPKAIDEALKRQREVADREADLTLP